MRKALVYTVDIVCNEFANILECQCECAAGMGPDAHRKHIHAVMYALYEFTLKNVMKTEETCTQKLQTFHQTKKYSGTPQKAAKLRLRVGKKHLDIQSGKVIFYQRPVEFINRNGYQDNFRNECINFAANQHNSSMPLLQLCLPASPYALENDHDYVQISISDLMIQNLNLSNMSPEFASEIEIKTRGQALNGQWHKE